MFCRSVHIRPTDFVAKYVIIMWEEKKSRQALVFLSFFFVRIHTSSTQSNIFLHFLYHTSSLIRLSYTSSRHWLNYWLNYTSSRHSLRYKPPTHCLSYIFHWSLIIFHSLSYILHSSSLSYIKHLFSLLDIFHNHTSLILFITHFHSFYDIFTHCPLILFIIHFCLFYHILTHRLLILFNYTSFTHSLYCKMQSHSFHSFS